jgi:hypothetical protein
MKWILWLLPRWLQKLLGYRNALDFLASSGNITSGTVRIYGVKERGNDT